MIKKPIRGIVHGKTIELSEESGCADGAIVEVELRAVDGSQAQVIELVPANNELTEAEWDEWEATMAEIVALRKYDGRRDVEFQ
jgi:hypothetical protein